MYPFRLACFFERGGVPERCECEVGMMTMEKMRGSPMQLPGTLPMYQTATPAQAHHQPHDIHVPEEISNNSGSMAADVQVSMQMFLNRLPLFYDLITRPDVWSSGDTALPADDEDGDEVDESSTPQPSQADEPLPVGDKDGDEVHEPSTTQPTKVEQWLADLSIQQDGGAADGQPDTQTKHEIAPSAPSSSPAVAGLLESEGEPNEAPCRRHSRSGTA